MRKHSALILASITILTFVVDFGFAALPRYKITDLGTLGGGYSCAYAINDIGSVAGVSFTGHAYRAFLWNSTHAMIDLGILPGQEPEAVYSRAYGINDFGQVVGYSGSDAGSAFIWDSVSGMRYLAGIGDSQSEAWDINNRGQVVGEVSGLPGYAFLWGPDDGVIDLGRLADHGSSWAHAINDAEQVVGSSHSTEGPTHAFLWDSNNGMRDLSTLGGERSGAYGINNIGQVVGFSLNTLGEMHAFLWDSTTGMIDLGPGHAWAINDTGQVVGRMNPPGIPFYWDSTVGMIPLSDLLPPDSGWQRLSFANDINNRGQIVGLGITDAWEYHAFLMTPVPPKVYYVDGDAPGNNDGSSWFDAYNYLQDALTAAWNGDEIRVAQGVCKPDQDSVYPSGTGDRTATFQLTNGVTIKGGYAGFGEPDPNAYDVELYKTILSGDLDGNDVDINDPCDLLTEPTRGENSYHVVTGSGANASAALNGFTITGGNADGAWQLDYNKGAGMYNDGYLTGPSNPTVTNCTFSGNSAISKGGGMCNTYNSSPAVHNCTFSRNWARNHGGGMATSYNSSPTLFNCSFSGNSAGDGAGLSIYGSAPTLTNCVISRNYGAFGGGINTTASRTTFTNCIFSNNSASNQGGGMCSWESEPILSNCTFTGNYAPCGGGMYHESWEAQSTPLLINCILKGNSAEEGGAVYNYDDTNPRMTNCTFTGNSALKGNALACDSRDQHGPSDIQLTNCILWDGGNEIWNNDGSIITITYSDVQGSWPGDGNIDADPCFVEPGYWDPNGTPDDANDDFWVDGDYHLLSWSPCIDAGDNNSVPADIADLDGDGNTAEPIPWDLEGNPRIVDGDNEGNSVVDMGAYEANYVEVQMKFTPQALNPGSQGNWFKLHFVLPEGFVVEDVDVSKPALCKLMDTGDVIKSVDMNVFVNEEDLVKIEAFFDRGAFSLCRNGLSERTVSVLGILCGTGGQYFYGMDNIKIINKTWEHLAGLTLHWLEEGCGGPDWCGGIDLNQDSKVDFLDLALFDGCCIEIVAE